MCLRSIIRNLVKILPIKNKIINKVTSINQMWSKRNEIAFKLLPHNKEQTFILFANVMMLKYKKKFAFQHYYFLIILSYFFFLSVYILTSKVNISFVYTAGKSKVFYTNRNRCKIKNILMEKKDNLIFVLDVEWMYAPYIFG